MSMLVASIVNDMTSKYLSSVVAVNRVQRQSV